MDLSIISRNNVKVWGNGTRPMMFAHGFGCDQNMWRYITHAFENDFKLIAFDYVGAGKSDLSAYNDDRYSNLNGYADDILEICKSLRLEDIVFVGHSVSCMTGLLAANRKPSIFSKMIFISPSPSALQGEDGYNGGFQKSDIDELLEIMDNNYVSWAAYLSAAIMQNPENPGLLGELHQGFCTMDPTIARKFAKVAFFADNRSDLKYLRVPSLIMQCTDDLFASLEVGAYLHKHMQLSTLKVMKATGHCPHMSAPEETISIIKEYLNNK